MVSVFFVLHLKRVLYHLTPLSFLYHGEAYVGNKFGTKMKENRM